MDVTPLVRADRKIIQSYNPGTFRVSGSVYDGAVFVFPDRVEEWTFEGNAADLTAADCTSLFSQVEEIDVVLLGGGPTMPMVGHELRLAFKEKKLPLEIMDTGAACRTYNVLMAEGRRVVAALLPV